MSTDDDNPAAMPSFEVNRLVRDLRARVAELEAAIREHRDQGNDDRCWIDDRKLYEAIGDVPAGDLAMSPEPDLMESCRRYWRQRRDPGRSIEGGRTIAQLEVEVNRLVIERDAMIRHCIYPGPDGVWRGLIHADALAEQWGYFASEAAAVAGVRRAAGLGAKGPGMEG